jgi:hypothetical protein
MSMTRAQNRPRCGTRVPAHAPGELCPRCVMAMHPGPETGVSVGRGAGLPAVRPRIVAAGTIVSVPMVLAQ